MVSNVVTLCQLFFFVLHALALVVLVGVLTHFVFNCCCLQLGKAVLLEGSPGVGKTSLVSALSRAAGVQLVRINCSEHTDMIDLLGADLPAPGGAAGQFAW